MNMRTFTFILLCGWALQATAAEKVQFNRDVRKILAANCFSCHGQDAKKRKAKLRLDEEDGALEPRNGVAAIVPGNLAESEMWQRIITDDPDELMPPPVSKKTLTAEEKDILKRWIQQGAKYEEHWAFIAPKKPAVPKGTANPIDAFLQRRLTKEGFKPAPLAKSETLVRRLHLDLTGLPPTPKEVDAFLTDKSANKLERLIGQLMKRPTYGEHMARYWLDLARYADTHGLHLDNERSMWPYRDWVVRAFNQNIKFDDFTRWQLAGDLLPKPTMDQKIASGFNRCNVTTSEGGSIGAEWIYRYAVDRTSTAVEVWMGLTAGCAVCHSLGGATNGGVPFIGPELSTIGNTLSTPRIVEEVLWPGRHVKEGFSLARVTTQTGEVHTGYEQRSRSEDLFLRPLGQSGTIRIPRDTIRSHEQMGSAMLPGLTAGLQRGQLRDLIRFLAGQGRN